MLGMPQIFTASWRADLPASVVRVGISRSAPRSIRGYHRFRALEPGPWFRSASPARYLEHYREILDRLDPAAIYDRLLASGDRPAMLCWERACEVQSGKTFCHRHLVAQWLEDRLGISVCEFDHPHLDRFGYLKAIGIGAPNYSRR